MMQALSPHTMQIVVLDFFVGLHFRAFIETGRDDPEVLFSLNDVTNASRVDFVSAAGGARKMTVARAFSSICVGLMQLPWAMA